jgi:formate hydrogenlyase subunit 5
MQMLERVIEERPTLESLSGLCRSLWKGRVSASGEDQGRVCRLDCGLEDLIEVCDKLANKLHFVFASLIVEEDVDPLWSLTYAFYKDAALPWVHVTLRMDESAPIPSISAAVPAADWLEREAEDLFGLHFEGHPQLGDFVLHEGWPDGVNPMRRSFDPRRFQGPQLDQKWEPPMIVEATGAFAMPVGPIFSDFAESAHFLLETVGEDVINTIQRFFYKYRGVEKIAEGQKIDRALLLAERFSGTAAFAHGLAFCQAVEAISEVEAPPRAKALRTVFAELERLRHHAAAITGICNSTALAVAMSQAALIEEELLRLSCEIVQHRYFFGAVKPGGLACDLSESACQRLAAALDVIASKQHELDDMLRYSSSFLDRLEEVGIVQRQDALALGLSGPIARASGVERDLRKLFPYAGYEAVDFKVPVEEEGDGYARLRVLFQECAQSAAIIRAILPALPAGLVCTADLDLKPGAALSAVEAPLGAAFHWVRIREDGAVARYRITPPSFANWRGFLLAAENFAFQDFPIILASFGLSNAECDR